MTEDKIILLVKSLIFQKSDIAREIGINNGNDFYVFLKNGFPIQYNNKIIELAKQQQEKLDILLNE